MPGRILLDLSSATVAELFACIHHRIGDYTIRGIEVPPITKIAEKMIREAMSGEVKAPLMPSAPKPRKPHRAPKPTGPMAYVEKYNPGCTAAWESRAPWHEPLLHQ